METTITSLLISYMPIITLFIGAILGFLFSLWKDRITENRKKEKEDKELAIKRLEEIFINISKLNATTLNTYTDLISNRENKENEYTYKISFLIRSFFTQLQKSYNEYLQIYIEFKQIQINMYLISSKNEQIPQDILINYEEKTKSFTELSKNFLSLIIEETKNYK